MSALPTTGSRRELRQCVHHRAAGGALEPAPRRLCEQGLRLYTTGELQIRLERPDLCFDFGERIASGDIEVARTLLAEYEYAFDNTVSPLPMLPDSSKAEVWCRRVRRWYYDED